MTKGNKNDIVKYITNAYGNDCKILSEYSITKQLEDNLQEV